MKTRCRSAARNALLKETAAGLLARIESELAGFDLRPFRRRQHRPWAGAGLPGGGGRPEPEPVRAALETLTVAEGEVVDVAANAAAAKALRGLTDSWRNLRNLEYEHSGAKHVYRLLFEGLFVSLGSAMFSLLGFYIAAAA